VVQRQGLIGAHGRGKLKTDTFLSLGGLQGGGKNPEVQYKVGRKGCRVKADKGLLRYLGKNLSSKRKPWS